MTQIPFSGWQPNPEVIQKTREERPGFCFEENLVPEFDLPPLWDTSSQPTPEEWRLRRRQILHLFQDQVFGHFPDHSGTVEYSIEEKDTRALDGAATRQQIKIHCRHAGRELAFECLLFLPNHEVAPHPVFLLLNNRRASNADPTRQTISDFWPVEKLIARGYGAAVISVRALAPDSAEHFQNGVIHFLEGESRDKRSPNAGKTLAAWAWGAQRVMDFFETQETIDTQRIALVGHSRGGKAALWTGALDERFALVISNNSGCGGAALSRRKFGETIARINSQYPHWFCQNFHAFNDREGDLPFDQHMLLALMAPRAVYVASADSDLWADPRGEFLALAHASPAFALYGHTGILPENMPGLNQPLHADRQGYHIRSGAHNLTLQDWEFFMDYADRLWPRPSPIKATMP